MRNIILALLVANILYFMYERFVEAPPEFGVAVVNESELGPKLELADVPAAPATADTETGAQDVAVEVIDEGSIDDDAIDEGSADVAAIDEEGPPEPVELAAVVGRSCVTVGPFKAGSDANSALAEFEADGMQAAIRSTDGDVFVGHWVQIRNVADRGSGNQMLETLREGGLADAYLVETEEEGLKISLGLFGELARAERIELQAKSLGLPADIVPRMRESTVFFVDIGLPPGRGAGRIVQKYGEDRVFLRDLATCPGSG
jgi:hypothetical protein